MATTSITPTLYKTYVTNYQTDHGYVDTDLGTGTNYYMGYSSSTMNSNNKMYCSVFKLTMPSSSYASSIESISITPTITMFLTGTLASNKYWYFTLHPNATEPYWACGDHTHEEYSTGSGRTQRTTNSSSLSGSGASATLGTMTFSKSTISAGNSSWFVPYIAPGQTIYLYCYSGIASICSVKVGLTCSVTYTPATYYATKGTCTYATASITPTSGTYGTSFTFTASSYANDDNYIYGGLTYTYGNNAGGGVTSPYASGYGAKQTITNTGTYSSNFTYTATATRYTATPVPDTSATYTSCTASNVKSTSARVNISVIKAFTNSGFLDSYYYISSYSGASYRSSNFSYKARNTRSTGYVNLSSLTAGSNQTWYVYARNSYNDCYYKIGSVNFTTDSSSYSQTNTLSSTGLTYAVIFSRTPTATTNLDGKTYFSINPSSSPVSSLNIIGSGSYGGNITISNLQSDKSYTLYTYVKSSVSGLYYPTGNVATFSTLPSDYTADCLVTGIGTDCAYLFATNFSSTTNLDGYYVTDIDYGDDVIPEDDIVNYKVGLKESKFVSDLVPGMTYTYYFYVLPSNNKLQKINSLTFTTRSSVVYYGENLTPHRIYMVRNGRLEGVSLYREGTSEILYLEDGSTITTSDGFVFNTTEGDIDI